MWRRQWNVTSDASRLAFRPLPAPLWFGSSFRNPAATRIFAKALEFWETLAASASGNTGARADFGTFALPIQSSTGPASGMSSTAPVLAVTKRTTPSAGSIWFHVRLVMSESLWPVYKPNKMIPRHSPSATDRIRRTSPSVNARRVVSND